MHNNKALIITIIVILCLVITLLISFLVNFLKGNVNMNIPFNFGFNMRESTELVVDTTYEEEINKIYIKDEVGDVFIKESSDDKIRLVIYADKDNTSYSLNNKSLSVNSKTKPCIGICFNRESSKVELYLPKSYAGQIEVEEKYGNISISEFLNAKIDVKNDAGDIKIEGGNEVTVNNNYGDIEVENATRLNARDDCGDIKIGKVEEIDAKNSYGSIKIDEISKYMNISVDCGDVKIDRALITKDSKIKNNLGDIKIKEAKGMYIDAKTDLGDVKVKNNDRTSEIVLTISNDCGDIEVNN